MTIIDDISDSLIESERHLEMEVMAASVQRFASKDSTGDGSLNPLLTYLFKSLDIEEVRKSIPSPDYDIIMGAIDFEVLLFIACREMFASATTDGLEQRGYSTIVHTVWRLIVQELMMIEFSVDNPLHYKYSHKFSANSTGAHKVAALIHAAKTHSDLTVTNEVLQWSKTKQLALSMKLIGIVLIKSKLFHLEHLKRKSVFRLAPLAVELMDNRREVLQYMYPINHPMVIPPVDWDDLGKSGGYLRNIVPLDGYDECIAKLVRSKYKGSQKISSCVLGAVNRLQKVSYRISRPVYDLLRLVYDMGGGRMGIPRIEPGELPPPIWNDEGELEYIKQFEPERWTNWKKQRRDVYLKNTTEVGKRVVSGYKLNIAEKMIGYERLWFPYFLDWRGRIYPQAHFVHPQSDDSGKALLEYSEPVVIRDWPSVRPVYLRGIAGLYGFDKVSCKDMEQWTSERVNEIRDFVRTPTSHPWESEADSPFGLYQLCCEFLQLEDGVTKECRVPVFIDGTCNGTQHLSCLMRDEQGAACVNLKPSTEYDKPDDIYGIVASASVEKLSAVTDGEQAGESQWLTEHITRKVVKRAVMTYPYGVTKWGIIEQFSKDLPDIDQVWKGVPMSVLTLLGRTVVDEIENKIPAYVLVKDWFLSLHKAVTEHNCENYVTLTMPNGFLLINRYAKTSAKEFGCRILGKRFLVTSHDPTTEPDSRRCVNGLVPNFTHAMDASHLMLTINALPKEVSAFTVIHDSFGTHAPNVDALRKTLVKMFEEMYTGYTFDTIRQSVSRHLGIPLDKLPPSPELGSFDITGVSSAYNMFR